MGVPFFGCFRGSGLGFWEVIASLKLVSEAELGHTRFHVCGLGLRV